MNKVGSRQQMICLQRAQGIATDLVELLGPACEKITVAGSVRRRKPEVHDIEILAIPKFQGPVDLLDHRIKELIAQGVLDYRFNKLGRRVYGPKNKLLVHSSGVAIDIFSTDEQCWAMALVIRTGPKELNMELARAALARGWALRAYGDGYDTPDGHIHCETEEEVFKTVGLPYREPWRR